MMRRAWIWFQLALVMLTVGIGWWLTFENWGADRFLLLAASALATVGGAAAVAGLLNGRAGQASVGLLIAGVASPTFMAYAFNLAVLGLAVHHFLAFRRQASAASRS